MKNNDGTLSDLLVIRKSIGVLNNQIENLIFQAQLVDITETIKKFKKQKNSKKITTSFLQKKFKIGYAHASKLLNTIENSKLTNANRGK